MASTQTSNQNKPHMGQAHTRMTLELTSEEVGWVKYSLIRASSSLHGRDKPITLREERLLLRIVRKIEKQEKQRGEG